MHVIRPKSAKGRTRPSLHTPQGLEVHSHCTPSSLPSAIPCEPPSSWKPGVCTPKSPNQGVPDEIPELLQQVSIGTSSSLNKYPVLPSINRKNLEKRAGETVAKKTISLKLNSIKAHYQEETCTVKTSKSDSRTQACPPEEKANIHTKRQGSRTGNSEELSEQEPRLLLAVRSPSGQRFIHHFRPTDALQTVVTVAEQKNNTTYPHCSIRTMEVPSRSFTDLTKSLQECQIPHKSVLSISQEDGEGWP